VSSAPDVDVVVVGDGLAGLSAGRRLLKTVSVIGARATGWGGCVARRPFAAHSLRGEFLALIRPCSTTDRPWLRPPSPSPPGCNDAWSVSSAWCPSV
jgi:glycine/D-amino acid oxidase-like deaminating enzyme